MTDTLYTNIRKNKNIDQVWFEGSKVEKSIGPGGTKYTITRLNNSMLLQTDANGERQVTTSQRNGKPRHIIDLHDKSISEIFKGYTKVRVTFRKNEIKIEGHHEETNKQKREVEFKQRSTTGTLRGASLFTGGGISTEAIHEAFNTCQLSTGSVEWICEAEHKYVESAMNNCMCVDDNTDVIVGKVEEVEPHLFAPIDYLSFSAPCAAFSRAGKVKHKQTEEQHSGVVLPGITAAISATNPALIISENVQEAQHSPFYTILKAWLTQKGYKIFDLILDSSNTGSIENRKRWWMVCISEGLAPDTLELPLVKLNQTPLSAILEGVSNDMWADNQYLKDKQQRDQKAGKGFAKRQLLSGSEISVGTIGRHYNKRRSTEPFVVRADGKERLFTPTEHAAVKSVPKHLIQNNPVTTAHEILGQSIDYLQAKFLTQKIIKAIC